MSFESVCMKAAQTDMTRSPHPKAKKIDFLLLCVTMLLYRFFSKTVQMSAYVPVMSVIAVLFRITGDRRPPFVTEQSKRTEKLRNSWWRNRGLTDNITANNEEVT